MIDPTHSRGLPAAQGLYDPAHERDACGIGFVANIKGQKSHDIILKGIQVLINLTHRGACGCDPETGDGAGCADPDSAQIFRARMRARFFLCRNQASTAWAWSFSRWKSGARCARAFLERIARRRSSLSSAGAIHPLMDRPSAAWLLNSQPRTSSKFHPGVRNDRRPARAQALRGTQARGNRNRAIRDRGQRVLYLLLTCRTIVYKGLPLAPQIAKFYEELSDPDVMSALCLHQRFPPTRSPAGNWRTRTATSHNGEINTLKEQRGTDLRAPVDLASPLFGDDIRKLFPIVRPAAPDSASFDNVLELISYLAGRDIPHAMALLIPEACVESAHEPGKEGVLRISRIAHGALGRPCRYRLHRRPRDRRDT
jgi:glutamate synthase domain-containing protein 1